ncbi:chlamydia polymorphic membrane middle domain protein, partial [Chlamydia psittaci 04DC42]
INIASLGGGGRSYSC